MGDHNIRIRWAAAGAALAIILGAGGIHVANATVSSGVRASLIPITPCRLADTRVSDLVGTRNTPLGPDDTMLLTAHGEQGNCHSVIPSTAAAVSLNVTAVGASDPTYLTVYPAGAELPTTSNLNPGPGQPPIPNAVTTDLSDGGQFNVFNKYGQVNVIVDVVGYFEDHDHDDRYYTEAEVNAAISAAITSALEQDDIITGWQILDGSLSLYDLHGRGSWRTRRVSTSPAAFSIAGNACITRYMGGFGERVMVVPYAFGIGIPNSIALTASPVVTNNSGGATFNICNGNAGAWATTSNVDMNYYEI